MVRKWSENLRPVLVPLVVSSAMSEWLKTQSPAIRERYATVKRIVMDGRFAALVHVFLQVAGPLELMVRLRAEIKHFFFSSKKNSLGISQSPFLCLCLYRALSFRLLRTK